MFWQDDPQPRTALPDSAQLDLLVSLSGVTLPVDHAYALWQALSRALPWLDSEARAGIHSIHVAASGNGWFRPEAPDAVLYLSQRTKLTLRLPRTRRADAQVLCGQQLDVQGHQLILGKVSERELYPSSTLFARHIASHADETEQALLERCAALLREQDLPTQKLLCGRMHRLRTASGEQATRSLLVAGLSPQESLRLQQYVLGGGNKLGCGLFIPHKGIAPVNSSAEDG